MEEDKPNLGGAPEGNKNAETCTIEEAYLLVELALESIDEDCYFLSSVAEKCGTYRQKFNYILEKLNNDKVVFNTIKRMYNKCEAIVMEKTAKGDIVPALGIFVLKAYHGLIETSKQQVDHTTKGESMNIISLGNGSQPN